MSDAPPPDADPDPGAVPPAPTGTRGALIRAGLRLFGKTGFAATSTRELAEAAGTNVASIAYHFGGKDGLRRACVEEVARRFHAVLGPDPAPLPDDLPAAAAHARLAFLTTAMVRFLLGRGDGEEVPAFLLREVLGEPALLDIVYDRVIAPRHADLCALWGRASGQDPDSPAVRLAVFAHLGQILYFRLGAAIVTRRMGWDGYGPAEIAAVEARILATLNAALSRGDPP